MKKLLLNLYFWPAFIAVTFFGLILLPFILIISRILLRRRLASSLRIAIRHYGWLLVCAVPFMAPVEVFGDTEKIPKPAIFIANHTSAIDPYLFGAIPAENCFVTSWPFKIPLYSLFMKLAGYINTAEGWDQIRRKCSLLLNEGVSVIIWPEGSRSRTGKMGRFRRGAFQLAAETGYPIQPVCIKGSGKILFPGERLLSPGRVSLTLLDPIYPVQNDTPLQDQINELRTKAFNALHQCVDKQAKTSPLQIVGEKRSESLLTPEKPSDSTPTASS